MRGRVRRARWPGYPVAERTAAEERAAVVAWLRSYAAADAPLGSVAEARSLVLRDAAEVIEAGEHVEPVRMLARVRQSLPGVQWWIEGHKIASQWAEIGIDHLGWWACCRGRYARRQWSPRDAIRTVLDELGQAAPAALLHELDAAR